MKRILYLGTDPAHFESQGHVRGHLIHYPVIKIVPRPLIHPELENAYQDLEKYTHLIFTSKNAVKIFFSHLTDLGKPPEKMRIKTIIAIGKVTADHLSLRGLPPQWVSQIESQEGVVQLIKQMDLGDAYFFMPRSSQSRPIIANYFTEKNVRYQACDLYDTVTQVLEPKPDLNEIDEIVFTSPSTVSAFLQIYSGLPNGKELIAIGPVTEQALRDASTRKRGSFKSLLRPNLDPFISGK